MNKQDERKKIFFNFRFGSKTEEQKLVNNLTIRHRLVVNQCRLLRVHHQNHFQQIQHRHRHFIKCSTVDRMHQHLHQQVL